MHRGDNLGVFYCFVNKRPANRSGIGVVFYSSGITLTDNVDKANASIDTSPQLVLPIIILLFSVRVLLCLAN